jgi:hypothetical protein
MATNTQIIEKARLGLQELTSGDGVLEQASAKEFLQIAVASSDLLPMCTVVPMRSPSQRINTIGIGSRVLRRGTPGQAVQEGVGQTGVDFTAPVMDAQLFRGEVPIDIEVFEDNIEQGGLRNTLMTLLPQAIARDMDELLISGDTASADPYLSSFDGLLKQVVTNTHDFSNRRIVTPANADPWADMDAMMRLVPRHWRRSMPNFKFLTSFKSLSDFTKGQISRETPLGDTALTTENSALYKGRSIVQIGMWPEDIDGNDTDQTEVVFFNPKNFHVGIWRNVQIELVPEPREGRIYFVISLRFTCKLAVEEACVKGLNVLNS